MELINAVITLAVTIAVMAATVVFGAGKLFQRSYQNEKSITETKSALKSHEVNAHHELMTQLKEIKTNVAAIGKTLEAKIDAQDNKLDTHILYHLEKAKP